MDLLIGELLSKCRALDAQTWVGHLTAEEIVYLVDQGSVPVRGSDRKLQRMRDIKRAEDNSPRQRWRSSSSRRVEQVRWYFYFKPANVLPFLRPRGLRAN